MIDQNRIIDQLLQMLTELGWTPPVGDWIDGWTAHDCITTDDAAIVGKTSPQTIRRRAEAAAAAGRPIGIRIAKSVWLISLRRLLDSIGPKGTPARVAAERRAEKIRFERAAPKIDMDERVATA